MSDNHNGSDGMDPYLPESLLPYDKWLDDAQRDVMLKALEYASLHGLPGEHHFYISFKTHDKGVIIPPHLRQRYPDEMTIVLQHQFDNLTIDRDNHLISVGLSFGGVHSILSIPIASIISFTDPYLHLMLRFNPEIAQQEHTQAHTQEPSQTSHTPAEIHTISTSPESSDKTATHNEETQHKEAEIVNLSAFRKKPPTSQQ